MQTAELSFPTRIVLAVIVGLASLVLFLAATFVMLGQSLRLNYRSAMTAFAVCCIASTMVAVLSGIGSRRSYVTGTERSKFISLAAVISILLPLASFPESVLNVQFENYWWFAFAAQFLISGLLGLAVAICRGGWWWLFAVWGTVLIGLGMADVPLWAIMIVM